MMKVILLEKSTENTTILSLNVTTIWDTTTHK